jgi:hypothetical protein
MITVVVLIAITGGAALGVACSALICAKDRAAGWLVVVTPPARRWSDPDPTHRTIAAEIVRGEDGSRPKSEACLDAAEPCRTIPAAAGGWDHPHAITDRQERRR